MRDLNMEFEGYFRLGTISRTHGVRGQVIITLDVDDPASYKKIKAVHIEMGGLLNLHKIIPSSLINNQLRVQVDGIDDMDSAQKLVGREVFLPITQLKKLRGNAIYFHEAIGMKVVDKHEGEIGLIQKIYELPQQPVASVDFHGKELLFPFLLKFIEKTDRANNTLHVNLPPGLIDIYR